MADVTGARSSKSPAVSRARLNPCIYKTIEDKIIVEDEFLHFLSIKLKTLSQDEIVLLAVNTFDSDWIETSKKTLYELCTSSQRNVSYKGAQKDINNVKACLKVLNECGDKIPRFVSHYLDELPPVTFSNMDVCGLLRKMEQLHVSVSAMKQTLQTQAEVSEGLHDVMTDLRSRVSALEHTDQGCGIRSVPLKKMGRAHMDLNTALDMERRLQDLEGDSLSIAKEDTPALCTGESTPSPGSPKWSQVVKRHHRQPKDPSVKTTTTRSGPSLGRRKAGQTIVGTGAAGNIKMVKTKLKLAQTRRRL